MKTTNPDFNNPDKTEDDNLEVSQSEIASIADIFSAIKALASNARKDIPADVDDVLNLPFSSLTDGEATGNSEDFDFDFLYLD